MRICPSKINNQNIGFMEKVILRKDYKVEKLPVEQAEGKKLARRVLKKWTETFVDEDTNENVDIERQEILLECGTRLGEAEIKYLQDQGIQVVKVVESKLRAEELTEWYRIGHVKVTMHSSTNRSAVLIVRSDSLRHAMDLAADYAEGDYENVFGDNSLCSSIYITKVEILNNIRFIGRTNKDIEEEQLALAADENAPKKEPFKVKANFLNADFYDPEDKRPDGVHKGDVYVVWAYDVVTAKNIVFDYIKANFVTVVNEHETLRVVGATQFTPHTYVPAEYCNEYIEKAELKLKVEE